jgi:hypothetical protein
MGKDGLFAAFWGETDMSRLSNVGSRKFFNGKADNWWTEAFPGSDTGGRGVSGNFRARVEAAGA